MNNKMFAHLCGTTVLWHLAPLCCTKANHCVVPHHGTIVLYHIMAPLCCTKAWHHWVVSQHGTIVLYHSMAPLCCTKAWHHCVVPQHGTIVLYHSMAPLWCTTAWHHCVVPQGTIVLYQTMAYAINCQKWQTVLVKRSVGITGSMQSHHFITWLGINVFHVRAIYWLCIIIFEKEKTHILMAENVNIQRKRHTMNEWN